MPWQYSLQELADAIGAPAPADARSFSGLSTDTRTLGEGQVFLALKGEHFDGHAFVAQAFEKGACAAIVSDPCEGGACLTVDDTLVALGAFAGFHRLRHSMPLLALTGSCGKTTTKELAAALLATRYEVVKTQGNLNNEIGCPLSLLRLDSATEFGVFEMGANHRGEIARMCAVAQPTESAITMIAPAHLEGFGTLDDVARAKGEIMEALQPEGVFYVNSDDVQCAAIGERFAGEIVSFGKKGDVALESCTVDGAGEMILDIAPIGRLRLPLPLRCHAMNVALAVAIGLRHGVTEFEDPLRQALEASSRFKVLRVGPITVLDDTYNASPASVTGALEALADQPGGTRMAVLGEMLELGPAAGDYHRAMGEEAARRGVERLIVRGEHARDTITAALAAGMPHAESIEDHQSMAEDIHGAANEGDVVLVKGSRGMKMERVIEALRNLYGE